MHANESEDTLATADTQGYVCLWDISNYCTGREGTVHGNESPPVRTHWRAHVQPVVSIIICDHGTVITASTDYSVRVWSMSGEYIGTFGASAEGSWILQNTESLSLEEAASNVDRLLHARQSTQLTADGKFSWLFAIACPILNPCYATFKIT